MKRQAGAAPSGTRSVGSLAWAGAILAIDLLASPLGPRLSITSGAVASPANARRIGDELSFALPAVTLAVEFARRDLQGAAQFGTSFAATLLATEALKRSLSVERPDGRDDLSFPSGHAARAFAAATFVHRRHGLRPALPVYGLATFVGYTRVRANRHRWSDVIGSAAVAAASAWWLVDPKVPTLGVAFAPGQILVQFQIPLR